MESLKESLDNLEIQSSQLKNERDQLEKDKNQALREQQETKAGLLLRQDELDGLMAQLVKREEDVKQKEDAFIHDKQAFQV
jgi:septal ring factor EnvC (AmiA/AmiB activator)